MKTITSFCGLSLLLALGKFIRSKIEFFQLHHVPSSIIAGILGLMIIQISGDILPNYWTAGWSRLPVFLINIVFAAFPLGSSIPSFSSIWKRAGPQFVYGQIVAWGQYIIGIGLVLVMLGPLFTVPDLFGIIIPVGFEGGPGTAGGLRETFLQLGWAEGVDFSLASATVGVISAIIAGTALIHWAIKNGYISTPHKKNPLLSGETDSLYTLKAPSQMDAQSLSATSTSNFTLHVAIIGVSILIGYSLRFILVMIEKHALGLIQMKVFTLFPLFPLSMIGGLIVQFFLSRLSINSFQINNASVQQISGTAMDFLIISAISTIKVKIIVKKIIPFLLIITAGI
ncbi:MAG: hypothetical protein JXA79_00490, partial [Deltaproteobacteria bacterium]|nr:hypothetical protein [Deltaproteobacteria bacterium]